MSVEAGMELRQIKPSDLGEIKKLHEKLFPISYSDSFYEKACAGLGVREAPLFSLIIEKDGLIVGFILAQFMDSNSCEDKDLVYKDGEYNSEVMYILTLGCRPEYRRKGLASLLLKNAIEHANTNTNCGAVYLHVIHFNKAAIRFYEENDFVSYRMLYSFYFIDEVPHMAHLYIFYINGFHGSSIQKLLHSAHQIADNSFSIIFSWFSKAVDRIFDSIAQTQRNISDLPENSIDRDIEGEEKLQIADNV